MLSSNLNSLVLVFLRTYQKSLDLLNIFWVSRSEFQLLFSEMKIHPVHPPPHPTLQKPTYWGFRTQNLAPHRPCPQGCWTSLRREDGVSVIGLKMTPDFLGASWMISDHSKNGQTRILCLCWWDGSTRNWTCCKTGGPLPGPKSGLLSNTRKWIVWGDTCAGRAKGFIGKGHPGGEKRAEGTQENCSATRLTVSGFMVMGLVFRLSLASHLAWYFWS